MLVEAVGLPLLIGLIRGGKLKNLLNIEVKLWYLIVASGMLEFISSAIRAREIGTLWQVVDQNILWIHIISYGLLIIVLICNLKQKGFILLLIGTMLNFSVIMANEGRMPVEIETVKHLQSAESIQALQEGKDLTHVVLTESTRLRFLGDTIHLPKPYPFPKSLSIGDLFLILGCFWMIQDLMVQKKPKESDPLNT